MKQYIMIKLVLPVFCILFAMGISAQDIRSTYFLKGTSLNHRMNPAFVSEYNYVSIPVLGNMYIGAQANFGLSSFIYSYDNPQYDLTTFLNSSVDRESFLNKLHNNNKIDINFNTTILSTGFHAWGGFNTFELGLKSSVSLNLPYALFDFMKSGMKDADNTYHIKDLSARSNNYVELALGHARPIGDYLVVGAKIKGLVGIANLDAKFEDMYIKMNGNQWEIKADGTLDAAVKGGQFETDLTDKGKEITGFELNSPGIGGIGLGLDLGASYWLADNLTLSAAILDLGFISWSNSLKASNDGKPFNFKGFENIKVVSDDSNTESKSLDDQIDDITDDLKDMIKFYDNGKEARTTSLATTVNLGAEYTSYFYDRLTFGLLSSTRFNGIYTWSEARLSANVAPLSWFEASVSGGVSNYGTSVGGVLNFHPKGINFFVGADCWFTKVTPQFVPVNSPNLRVNFGFNITFGDNIFSE